MKCKSAPFFRVNCGHGFSIPVEIVNSQKKEAIGRAYQVVPRQHYCLFSCAAVIEGNQTRHRTFVIVAII